ALLVLAAIPTVPAGAEGHEAAKQRREEVRQQRAALSTQLDLLTADKAAVGAALDSLEANVAAAQAELASATAEAEAAWAREGRARVLEARTTGDLSALDAQVRDLAVNEFIGGNSGVGDLARFITSEDVGAAARVGYLAALEVERQAAVVDRLGVVRAEQAAAHVEAQAAARHALLVVEELTGRLTALDEARSLQAGFVAEVEDELERRLSEAAGLDQLDRELADEIRREEAALAARLAAEAAARAAAQARVAAERAAAERAAAEGTIRPVQHGPTTGAPRTLPMGSGTLVRVGTFVVDSTIGESLAAMLTAAAADGLVFGGGGYRDSAAQIELRRAHCGPTDHDIYEKPASSCRPPTARPGHSMHEQGLALDLTFGGALITTRSNPGFMWLAENAGRFGFRNLPSEPWHWSTTGR
ncbi:MAG: M15 family metallopeptidase, partial [Acidimicrobiales bacterium]